MDEALKDNLITNEQCSPLLLDNQLCFPLYVCAKEIISSYTPFLSKIDLTYTQYLTMMVLWEEKEVVTRHLKERLFLDSGTLTPVLKKLEEKGFITKERSKEDARDLIVTITKKGEALKNEAMSVPSSIGTCISDFKHQNELKVILDEMMQMFESRRNNKTK